MTKEYKGFLDEAIKLGGLPKSIKVTIPNKETYKIKDNYISVGAEVSIELEIATIDNMNDIGDMLYAYVRAAVEHSIRDQKAAKGISAPATQVPAQEAATVAQNGTTAGFGPPASESLASEPESHSEHEKPVPVEVVRFTLARRTDQKYDLALFQMYGNKVGKFAELKYTAEQDAMWQMIGHLVGDKSFDVMPVEYDVSWTALWEHGREYKKKDGSPGRYKDLTGLRQR